MVAVKRLAGLSAAALEVLGDTVDAALLADVEAGRAEVWHVAGDSYAVTRVEVRPDDRELVVCAYAGRWHDAFFDQVYAAAQAQGIASIRWHTQRRGLARLARRFRPELAELVYRVRVAPASQEKAA